MIFIDNKYTNTYYRIINRAMDRTLVGYGENHHIVPKCMGGIETVRLTGREHYICHWLLTKMTTGLDKSRMFLALFSFKMNARKRGYTMTSVLYEQSKIEAAKYLSIKHKGKMFNKTLNDLPRTNEWKDRQRQAQLGRKYERLNCPHCGTEMAINNIYRYHFDKCRTISQHQ